MSARQAARMSVADVPRPSAQRTPRAVGGRWRRVKTAILAVVLASAAALPWLRWPRGAGEPDQALLFDFPGGRAFVFGWTFGPQDLVLLLAVLLASAFLLFLTNTLVGRVWCGFTCPQTLWTDLFVMVERRLAPLGAAVPVWRRGLKHLVFAAIALVTGLTIVSYFTDAPGLWAGFLSGEAGLVAGLFVAIFAGLTYLLAGHARELVCLHMCPWPRFQSAMTDARTLVVTYDGVRGEPRGPLKRKAETPASGDCVDCHLCVAVCPTGIDIREGSQLGCIGCGLCIDACDGVMARVGRPLDLIGFKAEAPAVRTVRWRPLGFAVLAGVAVVLAGLHLVLRASIDISLVPERQPPYIRLTDGSIRNAFTLRLHDRRAETGALALRVEGRPGARLALATAPRPEEAGDLLLPVDPRRLPLTERLTVTLPPGAAAPGRQTLRVLLIDPATGAVLSARETYFWAPETGGRP